MTSVFASRAAILSAAAAFAGSAALTGLVRRSALAAARLDHPNERSSHTVPTPRGGGVGPVASWLIVGALLVACTVDLQLALILAAVALVAAIGWADDRWSLPVAPRLVGHLVAGLAVGIAVGGGDLRLVLGCTVSVAAGVNLVNFMDGIDGLVASQVVIFSATLSMFGMVSDAVHVLAAALLGAVAGFLVWNWPPARIFMGDVGSGSLGAITASLVWLAGAVSPMLALRAALPLTPLLVDAVATLTRRFAGGEPVWEAHRTHVYQELANGPWGHARTTVTFCGLALLGAVVAMVPAGPPLAVAAIAFSLLCVALWGAGLRYVRRRTRVVRQEPRKYL